MYISQTFFLRIVGWGLAPTVFSITVYFSAGPRPCPAIKSNILFLFYVCEHLLLYLSHSVYHRMPVELFNAAKLDIINALFFADRLIEIRNLIFEPIVYDAVNLRIRKL